MLVVGHQRAQHPDNRLLSMAQADQETGVLIQEMGVPIKDTGVPVQRSLHLAQSPVVVHLSLTQGVQETRLDERRLLDDGPFLANLSQLPLDGGEALLKCAHGGIVSQTAHRCLSRSPPSP
jgi:hypothetical protein